MLRAARVVVGVGVVAAAVGVSLGVLVARLMPDATGTSPRLAPRTVSVVWPPPASDPAPEEALTEADLRMTLIPPSDETGAAALAGEKRPDGQPLQPSLTPDRALRVAVIVDPAFRARYPDWQGRVERRIADADRLLREGGGIHLALAGPPAPWAPAVGADGIKELLVAVTAEAPDIEEATGGRFVLCVASRPSRETLDDKQESLCGLSRMFTDCAVVVDFDDVRVVQPVHGVTIAHEIAHCFGCFHYTDPRDVMVPKLTGALPDRFDAPNKEVLRLMRGVDLSAGERGVPEDVLVRVAELARDNLPPGERNSAADQISLRAYRVLLEGANEVEGVRLCRLALKFDAGLAGTRVNLAYGLYRLGDLTSAKAQLDTALAADPSLAEIPSVRQLRRALRARLGGDGGGSAGP